MDVALQQVRDWDSEKKQRAKHYAEMRYHSKLDRSIAVGDAVLLERKRENKLSSSYESQGTYLLFEILLRKNIWIRLNPRFSVPRRHLENSSKTPPFYFATEFEKNGSSFSYDVYQGRLDISCPLISFRMVQYTFEKCAETPSRGAIDYCSNISNERCLHCFCLD